QAYPGKDIPFSEDAVIGPRNFANKIWNLTRFVLMNMPKKAPKGGWGLENLDQTKLDLADRWILAEYQASMARVHEKMEAYNTAAAADELYGFLWDKFCDWYVELAKARFEDPEGGETVYAILVSVLTGTLKMLHPFMPFITEELYQALKPYSGESAPYALAAGEPKLPRDFSDAEAMKEMGFLMAATRGLRALRSQLNVPPGLKIDTVYEGQGAEGRALLERYGEYIKSLARLKSLAPSTKGRPAQSATVVVGGMSFYVPLAGIIDLDKERKRLAKEIDRLLKDLKRCESQLGNSSFLERAPEAEVAKIRQRKVDFESQQRVLADTLNSLQGD
ncbi:MAG: class I tRNA ligase family protein, partial [Elusimicrobiota bacterium]